jgi:hypothetical protein
MKFQPQTLIVFFFSYFAIFFTNGPLANAYAVTSLNASTSIVPISARGYQRGPCPATSPCKGDITHYEAGLGACGVTSDGTVDRVVALPDSLRGYVTIIGWERTFCGATITIKCTATGAKTTATVVGKCTHCGGYGLDLSNRAFMDLEDIAVGSTSATWWFND